MAYADLTFYKDTYKGTSIPDTDVPNYLHFASEDIDLITYQRIQSFGFDNLTAFQQKQIKKAECAQAETLYQFKDLPDGVKSYTVGDVSVNLDGVETQYNRQAMQYLKSTGYLTRTVWVGGQS